jgi:hypothetical protein
VQGTCVTVSYTDGSCVHALRRLFVTEANALEGRYTLMVDLPCL